MNDPLNHDEYCRYLEICLVTRKDLDPPITVKSVSPDEET